MRAIYINTEEKTVTEVQATSLEDMQNFVGGLIERAVTLPTGDCIFVNEEGLLLGLEHGFHVRDAIVNKGFFVGSGLVLGPTDRDGNTLDAIIDVDQVEHLITFF